MKFHVILGRIFAVFGSSALAALAGGAVIGVELWKAAAMAGFMAAGKVTESLLRAWSEDGVLSREEVAVAFGQKAVAPVAIPVVDDDDDDDIISAYLPKDDAE
jgi:hypothetical protein